MAEDTFMLVSLVIVMLVGSYMAGMIPLVMRLSEEKLKFVTVLGAGLLVGTALTVIIPEGIRSLYMDTLKPNLPEIATISGRKVEKSLFSATTETFNVDHMRGPDFSRTIGVSLVLGFVFMLLVDHISQHKSVNSSKDKNITATLGLVVHAAADGVALGAAATTTHQDVEIIVFLAIMLHKAPAAFGLVSFLLHEKIEHQEIRQEQKETLNSLNATGIAMLFSAGTFLYVATVHVLPELTHVSHSHSHGHYDYRQLNSTVSGIESQGDIHSTNVRFSKGLLLSEMIILICGALLPLIITFGHHH
ncbi:zinc transporter ZIP9-A isoform X2 [Bactrocera dorsalis]|uniref:Zinc transporter ZIP9-A isoform X2 n=1 Tax=Bactrocera dorsalis TaxID=27457 RepID=A0ABM3K5D2_BACDO|nr:zinc transporter ZIP9-A isoform X2 [Bactrocera dorsalis]